MNEITVKETKKAITLIHPKMELIFEKKSGMWKAIDKSTSQVVLDQVGYMFDNRALQGWRPTNSKISFKTLKRKDGLTLTITIKPIEGYQPTMLLHYHLFNEQPQIEFSFSVINHQKHAVVIGDIELMTRAEIFPGLKLSKTQRLDGGAGASKNLVENNWLTDTFNSTMLTGVLKGKRSTMVVGGLQYADFTRKIIIGEVNFSLKHVERKKPENKGHFLSLAAWDPQGKRVNPGETYHSKDTSYIDFVTVDPFDSLEQYGLRMREVNNANPHAYDFPTLCGWMVSTDFLGEGKPINHSTALINEVKIATKKGLTKYTPLAARLEPDYYCYDSCGDTQQGWWDDKHFIKYGALSKPNDSFKKFCSGVVANGGVPFTYMQTSMPSNDFALAHPEWMLNNDVSKVNQLHPHQKPLVRYDYSDPGFKKHMKKVWKYFKDAGLKGIKFDYPESGWASGGGFEDPSYTTTSAYREIYDLCKKGLGKDSYIHERNLGGPAHEKVPCLDATAGIVDLQRVWGDASHFEAEMASRIGLRWYKSRSVFHYYPDGKSFFMNGKELPAYLRRSFLNLIGFLSGRLEIGTSIGSMTDDMIHDLTRLYPIFQGTRSPRPVDMLCNKEHPEVYQYEVNPEWHQILLVNNEAKTKVVSTKLGAQNIEHGGLGLDKNTQWHVFDFWNQKYCGLLKSSQCLELKLRSGESAMISLRKKANQPQLLSTNRHFMQGLVECHDIRSENSVLSGSVDVVAGEEMVLSVASNGAICKSIAVDSGDVKLSSLKSGLVKVTISSRQNNRIAFKLS